jgi:hypothetical protein
MNPILLAETIQNVYLKNKQKNNINKQKNNITNNLQKYSNINKWSQIKDKAGFPPFSFIPAFFFNPIIEDRDIIRERKGFVKIHIIGTRYYDGKWWAQIIDTPNGKMAVLYVTWWGYDQGGKAKILNDTNVPHKLQWLVPRIIKDI